MTLLDERVRHWARERGGTPALVARDGTAYRTLGWAELDRATAEVAQALAGDRDGRVTVVPVSGDLASTVGLIGALRTDGPVLVLDEAAGPGVLDAVVADLLRAGHAVRRRDPRGGGDRTWDVTRPAARPARDLTGALLVLTGGSTGAPSLVVDRDTREGARRRRELRMVSALGWSAGQRQLVAGSVAHSAPLTFFVEGVCDGNTLVVPGAFTPSLVAGMIEDHAVRWLQVTPHQLRLLARVASAERLRSVRGLVHMSAVCPPALKRQWHALLGPERVHEVYGASEHPGLTLARGDEWEARPGTVGRGFFTHVSVAGPDGRPLPPGTTGDVYMRRGAPGRAAYRPYLSRAGRPVATLPDGSASVGDRGHLDEDGYLYLVSRQTRSVTVAGVTVVPSEVEYEILQHAAVADAAVVGVPDDRLGERLVALVVPAGPLRPGPLRAWLQPRLRPGHLPREVLLVDSLPRTEAGKLVPDDALRLAETAAGNRPGDVPGPTRNPSREGEPDGRTRHHA